MTIRRLLPLVFLLCLFGGMGTRVSAHQVAQYPTSAGWKYTVLNRVFYQAPTDWPNAYNARTQDAMATWTDLNHAEISFLLGGDAPDNNWSCGTSYDFLKETDVPAPGKMSTTVCNAFNSTTRIKVDPVGGWYTGVSTPEPIFDNDFQGFITHEFGHALQAWDHCTDGNVNDTDPCEGAHYDTTYNGLICDGYRPAISSTMCQSAAEPSSQDRSLEEHDRDLVNDMY